LGASWSWSYGTCSWIYNYLWLTLGIRYVSKNVPMLKFPTYYSFHQLFLKQYIGAMYIGLGLWCWMLLSTILQLYRGGQFYKLLGASWSWSYGTCSWIYNYICNQNLSPLKLWVRSPFMVMCTRYNIIWSSISQTLSHNGQLYISKQTDMLKLYIAEIS
jgi:hypothetical protein